MNILKNLTLLVFLATSAQNIFAAECGNPETDDVRIFRFLPPNNETWKNATPVIVEDGKTSVPMEANPDRCGWYFRCYVNAAPPSSVLIYPNESQIASEAIGANGNWEEAKQATPISINIYFELLGSNEIFFVADEKLTDPDNIAMGWTTTDPKVDCNTTSQYSSTNLNVINENTIALLEDNTFVGDYKVSNITTIANDTLPIYISSMPYKLEEKSFDATPAIGKSYSLLITDENGRNADYITLLYKDKEGKFKQVLEERTIGKTGVDTLYATLSQNMFPYEKATVDFKVKGGGKRILSIKYITPTLIFVDGPTSSKTLVQMPDTSKNWDGTKYNFYVMAVIPNENQEYGICNKCNFPLALGGKTSKGLNVADTSYFKIIKGRAAFGVYSTEEYSQDNPAVFEVSSQDSPLIHADYSPLYFRKTTNIPIAIKTRNIAASSFRIERSESLTFTIFTDKSDSKTTKAYAVFDMLGKEVKSGEINSPVTHVQLSRAGTYIVKVGKSYQQVEIR